MKKAMLFVAALVMAVGPMTALVEAQAKKKASVTVINKSDWRIDQLYLSSADDEEWGPDQLQEMVINPGETFTLKGIECDTYDIRIVDEDGDQCIVGDVELCGDKATWTITSKTLLSCQAAS